MVYLYFMILHTSLQELRENINQSMNPQKTPHTSPWWTSCGVFCMKNLEKIGHFILAPHCISVTSFVRICGILLKHIQNLHNQIFH